MNYYEDKGDVMKKYQTENLIGIIIGTVYLIMVVLWTVKQIGMGDIRDSIIGTGMTACGCAAILYQKEKHSKLVDIITIGGIILLFAYRFLLKK